MAKSKDSGKLKDSGNDVFDLKKFVSHYPSNIAILKQINQAIESFSEYDKMILRFARLLGVLYNSGIVDPNASLLISGVKNVFISRRFDHGL